MRRGRRQPAARTARPPQFFRCFPGDTAGVMWRWWSSADPWDVWREVDLTEARALVASARALGLEVRGESEDEDFEVILDPRVGGAR